jgi:hypothetical protein
MKEQTRAGSDRSQPFGRTRIVVFIAFVSSKPDDSQGCDVKQKRVSHSSKQTVHHHTATHINQRKHHSTQLQNMQRNIINLHRYSNSENSKISTHQPPTSSRHSSSCSFPYPSASQPPYPSNIASFSMRIRGFAPYPA